MSIRDYLEQKIPNYNGNNRVIGVLADGTEVELIYEVPGLQEDELMDYSTGMRFVKEEFVSFKNCIDYNDLKVRTKNHQARNHYAYKDSGKNHKKDKGNLAHLIK
jgi:hypothetical protein